MFVSKRRFNELCERVAKLEAQQRKEPTIKVWPYYARSLFIQPDEVSVSTAFDLLARKLGVRLVVSKAQETAILEPLEERTNSAQENDAR